MRLREPDSVSSLTSKPSLVLAGTTEASAKVADTCRASRQLRVRDCLACATQNDHISAKIGQVLLTDAIPAEGGRLGGGARPASCVP